MRFTRIGQRRTLALATSAAAAAGLMLAGCSSSDPLADSSSSGPPNTMSGQEGDIVIVAAEEPTSLDACDDLNSSRSRVLRGNVVEALTSRNVETGDTEPVLATSWTSTDNKTWVFELRQGVQFQDGEPFNSAAVVDAMNRLFDPNLSCDNANDIFNPPTVASTISTSEYEVTFTLDQPDPIFALRMSFVHISSPNTPTDQKGDPAVGTGPFQITEWAHGDHITLDRFGDYWGTKPSITSAKFVFRADSAVRAGMVKTGEADLAVGIGATDVQDGVIAQTFQSGETTYYRIDAESGAPLDDIRIREALNLAADRQGIIDSAFGGYAQQAHEIFVPQTLGYNADLEAWPYDPDQAKKLVQEAAAAGVDISKEIILYGRPDFYANADEVNQILADAWTKIGLNVRIQNLDSAAWGEVLLRPHDPGRAPNILQSSHGNTAGDASFSVVSKYTCDGSQSASCDPAFDQLVNRALAAADLQQRDQLFQQAMGIERNDVVQDVDIAHMEGIIELSGRLHYAATPQSDFELLLSDMAVTG